MLYDSFGIIRAYGGPLQLGVVLVLIFVFTYKVVHYQLLLIKLERMDILVCLAFIYIHTKNKHPNIYNIHDMYAYIIL